MKKTLAFVLTAVMSLSLLAGCGSKTTAPDNTNNDQPQQAALSGSVSTNGSTSMEKVIGALSEQFMADNSGVSVTYDPTGSGAGIEAASNGSADIGLASRALKDEEKAGGLTETVVALDGIAVIVNAGSKVEDLSVEQIAKIFTPGSVRHSVYAAVHFDDAGGVYLVQHLADFFHLGHHVGHEFLRPEARLHGHYEHHVALGKVGNGSFRRGFRLQGNGGFAAHSPDFVETGQRVLRLVGF